MVYICQGIKKPKHLNDENLQNYVLISYRKPYKIVLATGVFLNLLHKTYLKIKISACGTLFQ